MPSRAAALPGKFRCYKPIGGIPQSFLVSYSLSGMRYGASTVRVHFRLRCVLENVWEFLRQNKFSIRVFDN